VSRDGRSGAGWVLGSYSADVMRWIWPLAPRVVKKNRPSDPAGVDFGRCGIHSDGKSYAYLLQRSEPTLFWWGIR